MKASVSSVYPVWAKQYSGVLGEIGAFHFPSMSVAHGAEGFEDFGDVGGVGAGEAFSHGFGRDKMDRWHLMIFQRRGNGRSGYSRDAEK